MAERTLDLRDCPTAYECRDRLSELASWASEELLKQLPIWKGARLQPGQTYFDLDNPDRGPFVADDATGPPVDHTYVCRAEVPEHAWAMLITWRQPVSVDQAAQIEQLGCDLGMGIERSAAGEARPLPRE
jgi:hypothetical protein